MNAASIRLPGVFPGLLFLLTATSVFPGTDTDGDGVPDEFDNCPTVPNLNQSDIDGDRFGNPCDRALIDRLLWSVPGEVRDLILPDDLNLMWSQPAEPGGSFVLYDVIRSENPADFTSSFACVEADDGSDTMARDDRDPGMGGVLYYLVRVKNDCCETLGTGSGGIPRQGSACPE